MPSLLNGNMRNYLRELEMKVDSEGNFGNSLREHSKNIFEITQDFGNFSREHGNTDPPLGDLKFH